MLARASVSLARLRNVMVFINDLLKYKFMLVCVQVVEIISTVIEHLVKGEIMQMRPSNTNRSALNYYLRKNYYKTASLMGNSCLSAAILGTLVFKSLFHVFIVMLRR